MIPPMLGGWFVFLIFFTLAGGWAGFIFWCLVGLGFLVKS